MQRTNRMSGATGPNEVVRLIVGIISLILVTGLWAYLWIPPSPVF
ncbi:MAG: hypothetical protein U9R15_08460 [Chloroflexota bacterium]|nr:hypothetical protein [Chloroflexota bacterium]